MPITITGDFTAYSLDDALNAAATVHVDGDDVVASTDNAPTKALLDYVASIARQVVLREVPTKLQASGSIGALRAISDMVDGQVRLVRIPTYTGGTSGVVTRVALFVYDASSSLPETALPNLSDAYLVVQPTSGVGRWINVVAGVGWQLGPSPRFLPKPVERVRLYQDRGAGSGLVTTAGESLAWLPLTSGIQLTGVLSTDDEISLDATFYTSSATASASPYGLRIEVDDYSDSWQPVIGSEVAIGDGASNDIQFAVHLGGHFKAPGNHNYRFRVAVYAATGQTVRTSEQWSFRGLRIVAA